MGLSEFRLRLSDWSFFSPLPAMNDRIDQQITDLDQYSNRLEKEIQRFEHLYDLYIDSNPNIATMFSERLDELYASRRKERKE